MDDQYNTNWFLDVEPPSPEHKSNTKKHAFFHLVTSVDDILDLLRRRKESPDFLMLDCEFRDVAFHPKDPRISEFFDVFGLTLIQLKLKRTSLSNEVLRKFFKRKDMNLASLAIKIQYNENAALFPSVENEVPVVLPKLGVLHISGLNRIFRPRLDDILTACPNLLELYMDTQVDFSHRGDKCNFEKLQILQLKSYRLHLISDEHIDILGEMNLKTLKGLHLIGVSYNVPFDKVNGLLESLGSSLEELQLKMTKDVCNPVYYFREFCSSNPSQRRRFKESRYISARESYQYQLPSPFPLRLPNLKKLVTNMDFQCESKLFVELPLLKILQCNGALQAVSGGIFPNLCKLDLNTCDDSLLFDIYRSFPNVEEIVISDGESVTDVGFLGNRVYGCILDEDENMYMKRMAIFDAKSIYTLTHLKKFWALLSSKITDISVSHGFSKCLQLEELGLSNSCITTESLVIIKKELGLLKNLQVRKCVNIPYLDVVRIFYKPGEKKVKVIWS